MTWRWSWHPWGPLCCGLLSALVAVYLIQAYIEQQLSRQQPLQIEPPQQNSRVEVIVANQPLETGQALSMAVLSARQVAAAGVAADTLHPAEANWLAGQHLAHPVSAGQPIQRLHLAIQQSSRPFSALLKRGQRALTLNVGPQQSHAGLISLGDRVDFFDLSSPQPRLLDNAVAVIATGANFQSKEQPGEATSADLGRLAHEYRTLTFAIDAEKVPVYELLQQNQQLGFWLRAPADGEILSELKTAQTVDWIIGGRQANEQVPLTEPSWL